MAEPVNEKKAAGQVQMKDAHTSRRVLVLTVCIELTPGDDAGLLAQLVAMTVEESLDGRRGLLDQHGFSSNDSDEIADIIGAESAMPPIMMPSELLAE